MTRGTLWDRYQTYVRCMVDLGLPYVDYETWLSK